MTERLQLPLRPVGTSIAAHAAVLDLLAARLDTLASRSRWPARVPINSKASFDGDIVHTSELKVNVGGEWWIEMTAGEAADYVRRKKLQMLEDHARIMEGQRLSDITQAVPVHPPPGAHAIKTADIRFDPLFAHPVRSGPSSEPASVPSPRPNVAAAAQPVAAPVVKEVKEAAKVEGKPTARALEKSKATESETQGELPESLKKLMELMGSGQLDKMALPRATEGGGTDGTTINEEGLPIHEIREALDGTTLGPTPEPTGEAEVVNEDKDDDYFSPEAVRRREELRRRIFNDDDSDDDDDDDEETMDVDEKASPMDVDEAAPAAVVATLAPSSTLAPTSASDAPTTPTMSTFSIDAVSPATSATLSPSRVPKGILKAPARKKSVTFDSSVPVPPDSPPVKDPRRMGFPIPLAVVPQDTSSGNKPIPILGQPTPGRKPQSNSFAGFKSGFLSGPGSKPSPVPQIVELAPEVEDVPMEEPKKKPSLFAQRRAEANSSPSLPKLADAKPMVTMKNSIVENAPVERRPTPVPGMDLPPIVKSVLPSVSPIGSASPALSGSPMMPSPAPEAATPLPQVQSQGQSQSQNAQPPVIVVDDDDDDSDYGDLGDFSDDEEDEYNLDEALLAREVALEYHRRQAWQRPIDEDEIDPESEEGQQVLMGVPRVSTITGGDDSDPLRIVNPTADDLSQFLRVGRAEDGELVFEPPMVDDQSESEGEDDDEAARERRERRARRHDVMERLLRGEYEDTPVAQDHAAAARHQQSEWQQSLPPAVASVGPVVEEVDPGAAAAPLPVPVPAPLPPKVVQTRDVVERSAGIAAAAADDPAPAPPKKVSRFKAARQGLS